MPLEPGGTLALLGDTRPGMSRAERRRRGRELIEAHLDNVTAEEHSSNGHLAETVLQQSETREVSDLLARSLADHGTDALAEIGDLVAMTAARDQGTAHKLVANVAARLRQQGQFIKPGRPRGLTERQPATTARLEVEDVIGGLESLAQDPHSHTATPSRLTGDETRSSKLLEAFAHDVNMAFRGNDTGAKKRVFDEITRHLQTEPDVLTALVPIDQVFYREAKRRFDVAKRNSEQTAPVTSSVFDAAEALAILATMKGVTPAGGKRIRRAGAGADSA